MLNRLTHNHIALIRSVTPTMDTRGATVDVTVKWLRSLRMLEFAQWPTDFVDRTRARETLSGVEAGEFCSSKCFRVVLGPGSGKPCVRCRNW
jgi:hypothetical protein